MDTFLKKMSYMLKAFPRMRHVTKEKRKNMLKGEGLQIQKMSMVGEVARALGQCKTSQLKGKENSFIYEIALWELYGHE